MLTVSLHMCQTYIKAQLADGRTPFEGGAAQVQLFEVNYMSSSITFWKLQHKRLTVNGICRVFFSNERDGMSGLMNLPYDIET